MTSELPTFFFLFFFSEYFFGTIEYSTNKIVLSGDSGNVAHESNLEDNNISVDQMPSSLAHSNKLNYHYNRDATPVPTIHGTTLHARHRDSYSPDRAKSGR